MSVNRHRTANSGSFKPGVSGNPSGRPRRTREETDTLEEIKSLAPTAALRMRELLDNPTTPDAIKVRVIEIILERTYGKPESAVKLTTAQQSAEAATARIASLVDRIRLEEGIS